MTDREMLELAAKAAGYRIAYWTEDSSGEIQVAVLDNGDFWQPLRLNTHTDFMGDALRLAVKLDISVKPGEAADSAGNWFVDETTDGDEFAATGRAIVHVAAEIGRVMG